MLFKNKVIIQDHSSEVKTRSDSILTPDLEKKQSSQSDFENLNEKVEYILKISECENKNGRDCEMRIKKNKDQVKILENEYEKN